MKHIQKGKKPRKKATGCEIPIEDTVDGVDDATRPIMDLNDKTCQSMCNTSGDASDRYRKGRIKIIYFNRFYFDTLLLPILL